MDYNSLANQAEELKSVSYKSPRIDLWKNRKSNFVKSNYGQQCLSIFESCLYFDQIIMNEPHGQQMHIEAMDKAIEFLQSLAEEPRVEHSQDEVQAKTDNKPIDKHHYASVTINGGNVMLGDGNTLTHVSVKELITALSKEIKDKVKDSPERKSALRVLNNITQNESFAAVTGSVIGEIIKRVAS